jgi:glycosyltransferase involved in cell wall biosynthesis
MPSNKVRISIIIPTYNRKEIVRILLNALRNDARSQAAADLEIIVANDRSTDGTGEMLAAEFPEIRVVAGPGKNAELAKRAAIEVCTGDYVVALDDDSLPEDGWIAKIIPAIERGEKIIQSKIVFIDQGQHNLHDESRKHWRVGFTWDAVAEAVLNGGFRQQYIPICHEFGLFVAREVLAVAPLDDPNLLFDHQGEAASFYLRIHRMGYRVFFDPSCVIDHLGALHGGCKDRDGKAAPKKNCTAYAQGMVRNRMVLAMMHSPLKIPLLIPYYVAGGFYLSFKQRKPCYRYFLRGIRDGLLRRTVPIIPYLNLSNPQ